MPLQFAKAPVYASGAVISPIGTILNANMSLEPDMRFWTTVSGTPTMLGPWNKGLTTQYPSLVAEQGNDYLKDNDADSSAYEVEQEVSMDAPLGGTVRLVHHWAHTDPDRNDNPYIEVEFYNRHGSSISGTNRIERQGATTFVWNYSEDDFTAPNGTASFKVRLGSRLDGGSLANGAHDYVQIIDYSIT